MIKDVINSLRLNISNINILYFNFLSIIYGINEKFFYMMMMMLSLSDNVEATPTLVQSKRRERFPQSREIRAVVVVHPTGAAGLSFLGFLGRKGYLSPS